MQKINYIKREKCAINNTALKPLAKDEFPLFCGCVENARENDYICEQNWVISEDGVIQLQKLIPLDLLYQNGHGSGCVGTLWEEHHKEFANFLMQEKPKEVLEIGGGHGKLAQNCLALAPLNWTIVEPNSSKKYENVKYIDAFFHKELLENKNFDYIVHSHTFEHIYNPCEFLQELSSAMKGGGGMIFSLPNMQKWLENKFTNCLNFEHTLFLNENIIEFLLAKYQFKIRSKKYFKEHSIFYSVYKDENIDNSKLVLKNEFEKNKKLFLAMRAYYQKEIARLNAILENSKKKIYLFGAHLFGQYLIYQGLNTEKIIHILDNNPNKQEKRLYGTKFIVKSPKILKKQDNALLILNAGVYNDEIQKDILQNINSKVEIIKL